MSRFRTLRTHGGFVLAEAVVAGTLALVVIQVAWGAVAVQSAVAGRAVQRAQILDEARLVRHLLAIELGQGRGGVDWRSGGDTLRLRAFRGAALDCAAPSAQGWLAMVSGYRALDPAKDSALIFTDAGEWRASRVVYRGSAGGSACSPLPGFAVARLVLDPPRPDALAALWFERGAYRPADGTLRYRSGLSGWQPLISAVLDTDSTRMVATNPNTLEVRFRWEGEGDSSRVRSWTHRGLER